MLADVTVGSGLLAGEPSIPESRIKGDFKSGFPI